MTLQERKDTADIIAKEADVVYKKLLVLIAVSGAIGGFGLSIIRQSFYYQPHIAFAVSFFIVRNCIGILKIE